MTLPFLRPLGFRHLSTWRVGEHMTPKGQETSSRIFPPGYKFAFSIFDDTDRTTLHNGPQVYQLLNELGFAITKSVWVDDPGPHFTTGGSTCAEPAYLDWVLELQTQGHEIGYHNATDHSSTREQTLAALEAFEKHFGHPPRCGADHAANAEALYAGAARVSGISSAAYRFAQKMLQPDRPQFSGEDPTSPYFWGDLCAERIDYWRGFSFAETDLRSVGPILHHDPSRAYVNAWFTSSHAPRLEQFLQRLRPDRLDRLEESGGVCILYTHFGLDFVGERGRLEPEFVTAMTDLAARGGWYVPVSTLLDAVRNSDGCPSLSVRKRAKLERNWMIDRVRDRSRFGPRVATHDQNAS